MKVKENRRRCLIIIEISNKKECSGCYACVSICPKRCISMQIDNEGFWYPLVDKNECIECGMCEKHCPVKKSKRNYRDIEGYAAINKNSTVQKRSSSGGVFTLLAEYVLENGGVVYGAAFDEEYMVRHIGVERIHELGKLQGSKYVQSQMGSIYLEVKEKLNRGKIVYFSGTPCQVDGLIAFLGKEYDNLICQDIICHGVPSPKIWKQYLKQFNIEKNAKILFRDKRTGWESYSFTIDQREKYTQRASENLYILIFKKIYIKGKLLAYIGKNSLIFYVLHQNIIMPICGKIFKYIVDYQKLTYIKRMGYFGIETIMVCMMIVPCAYIINKFFPFIVGKSKK